MLQYVIAGLVTGGVWAIAASGLVVTYQSAGILNFAFGAIAFGLARFYYWLNTQHNWSILPAGVLTILVVAPLLGVGMYFALFRRLRLARPLTKIVATVGISVSIPPLTTLLFGNQTILSAPGLAPEPLKVFRFLGVPVNMDQIIVYGSVLFIVVAGVIVLRFTDIGLRVRAMVDSPAMTSLSGTNPDLVSMGVWVVSITMAGLVGVITAPIIGLDQGDMTLLMVAAFAAVIAARLRSLPVAMATGLIMGIAGSLVTYWFTNSTSLSADVIPAIPFIVTAVFLIYFMIRRRGVDESEGVGGALDRAIMPQGGTPSSPHRERYASAFGWKFPLLGFGILCVVPIFLSGFWVGQISQGIGLGIIFLSFTLVTGEGGMIWLCQATFAGIGAVAAAQLAVHHGWPVMASVLVGGLIALPFGVIIGMLTIRMGNLYVALVTITFGLLFDDLVFTQQIFSNYAIGVNVTLPSFASSPRAFTYLSLAVFAILSLLILNLRKSTTGLALNAVRWSPSGARTLGISVLGMKVLVSGMAAFVAGIGGAMYALSIGSALPTNYSTLGGLVWLAILVTLGIRSNVAALIAGVSFTVLEGIALVYLPTAFGQVTPVLFGLGAIQVAKFPDGAMTENARQVLWFWDKVRNVSPSKPTPGTGAAAIVGGDVS